jgi:hypothetical protein
LKGDFPTLRRRLVARKCQHEAVSGDPREFQGWKHRWFESEAEVRRCYMRRVVTDRRCKLLGTIECGDKVGQKLQWRNRITTNSVSVSARHLRYAKETLPWSGTCAKFQVGAKPVCVVIVTTVLANYMATSGGPPGPRAEISCARASRLQVSFSLTHPEA